MAEVDLRGKRVFIRADLNVPQDESGRITDDTRIRRSEEHTSELQSLRHLVCRLLLEKKKKKKKAEHKQKKKKRTQTNTEDQNRQYSKQHQQQQTKTKKKQQ